MWLWSLVQVCRKDFENQTDDMIPFLSVQIVMGYRTNKKNHSFEMRKKNYHLLSVRY